MADDLDTDGSESDGEPVVEAAGAPSKRHRACKDDEAERTACLHSWQSTHPAVMDTVDSSEIGVTRFLESGRLTCLGCAKSLRVGNKLSNITAHLETAKYALPGLGGFF